MLPTSPDVRRVVTVAQSHNCSAAGAGGVRSCVHQPAAGGHVKAARCGKSTPEATRRGSKRAAATREGGCVHTRPRPGPLFTTRPRLAVRTELPLCALAPRLSTHQWDLTSSNFAPAHVGTVASELGRAAVPQGSFQAAGRARRAAFAGKEARRSPRMCRDIEKTCISLGYRRSASNG